MRIERTVFGEEAEVVNPAIKISNHFRVINETFLPGISVLSV
jgi:hypothetical protein